MYTYYATRIKLKLANKRTRIYIYTTSRSKEYILGCALKPVPNLLEEKKNFVMLSVKKKFASRKKQGL